MHLRTPAFWYEKTLNWKAMALLPLSALYYLGRQFHKSLQIPQTPLVPTICVGNIVAGGSGKTPIAMALHHLISSHMPIEDICFLTRGYGGKETGPIFVQPDEATSTQVGDEPLLLSRRAQTILSKNRLDGVDFAADNGIPLLIMDDGLQNRRLRPDIRILVIQSPDFIGNGCLLPAGPLRETPRECLRDVDAIIIIHAQNPAQQNNNPEISEHHVQELLKQLHMQHHTVPCFEALAHTDLSGLNKQDNYLAFCGIARPQRFFDILHTHNISMIDAVSFPDHFAYTDNDIHGLAQRAKAQNARLLTTEKDFVRIPSSCTHLVSTVPMHVIFKAPDQLLSFLKNKLHEKTTLFS